MYVTNRGHDSIAVLDGDVKLLSTVSSSGRIPWTLADAGNGMFVVTNQFNHQLKDPGNLVN